MRPALRFYSRVLWRYLPDARDAWRRTTVAVALAALGFGLYSRLPPWLTWAPWAVLGGTLVLRFLGSIFKEYDAVAQLVANGVVLHCPRVPTMTPNPRRTQLLPAPEHDQSRWPTTWTVKVSVSVTNHSEQVKSLSFGGRLRVPEKSEDMDCKLGPLEGSVVKTDRGFVVSPKSSIQVELLGVFNAACPPGNPPKLVRLVVTDVARHPPVVAELSELPGSTVAFLE